MILKDTFEDMEKLLIKAYLSGVQEAYEKGREEGFQKGLEEGQKTGFDDAYQKGFDDGVQKGKEEADISSFVRGKLDDAKAWALGALHVDWRRFSPADIQKNHATLTKVLHPDRQKDAPVEHIQIVNAARDILTGKNQKKGAA